MEGPPIYNYPEVDKTELHAYSNAIADIYAGKLDGLLVRNALPEATCDAIIAKMKATPNERGTHMPVAWCFPTVFAPLVQKAFRSNSMDAEQMMREYFHQCESIAANSESYFGVPVTELVEEWLSKFSGGKSFSIPHGYNEQGKYANTTFRSYFPKGVGNVSVHCGNYFQTVWQEFYAHLEEQVNVFDQLSYFFLLQDPEAGGELSLYDFEWEAGQGKKSNHENEEVMLPGGKTLRLKDRKKMMIRPRKGDLILFAGGRIWHGVEPVLGKRPRVTLAGFLSYKHGNEEFMYWT